MTTAAWIMLGVTWTVVIFFTGRFFYKVVTTPVLKEDGQVKGATEVDDISEHD